MPNSKENIRQYFPADINDAEGLAEAAYYSVKSTPAIIILDDSDQEIIGWRGVVPGSLEIGRIIKNIFK